MILSKTILMPKTRFTFDSSKIYYLKRIASYIVFFCLIFSTEVSNAQAIQRTRVLFLLDASFSMRKGWDESNKWQVATTTLQSLADSFSTFQNVEMGLRIFGHLFDEGEHNCKDSRLEIPIGLDFSNRLSSKLRSIKPKGITPIAYSIEKAALDFGEVNTGKNILILITDGEEACEGDPCKVSIALQKNNIVLKPFVIGMSLSKTGVDNFNCIGKTVNTNSAKEFREQLKRLVEEAISKTTLQINLNDAFQNATETDVNMSFYDAETGILKYNFYHSLNAKGLPDTITISPLFKYNIQVHTIPNIKVENVLLEKNRHNIIEVNAAQGFLHFKLQGAISKSAAVDRIKCLVHPIKEAITLHSQKINSKEKYLVGKYELEILTLPRIYIESVKIDQSKTTTVEIPAPGILTINKSYEYFGAILLQEGKNTTKLYDLQPSLKQETIALQPGKYHLVYRSKFAKTIHTTVDKEFEIISGGSVGLKL